MANGAVNPEEPLSKEHWINSFGLVSLMFGIKGSKTGAGKAGLIEDVPKSKITRVAGGEIESILDEVATKPIGELLSDKSKVVRTKLSDAITTFENSDEYINLSITQKKKIDRKIKSLTKGNVATADVNISSIKKEFSAHSQIHSIDSLGG